MQLTEHVHLLETSGFDLTDGWDAHAYLIHGGEQAVLVDSADLRRLPVTTPKLITAVPRPHLPDGCRSCASPPRRRSLVGSPTPTRRP